MSRAIVFAQFGNDSHNEEMHMKSDTEIQRDVQNEMQWDPSLEESAIGVKVHDGVVTLLGDVPHYSDRWTAEDIAKRVSGVRAVANDIEVKIPALGERSDTDIASAAVNALEWNVSLGSADIKAVVRHGWITMSGQVKFGYQKSAAESAVRYLLGVKGIINDITVKPSIKMIDVKQKIEDAFQRQARLDAKDIDVDVEDNQITLKGSVHSWREKDDAARAAWAAPGVAKVENKLQVQY
jgi:osmotically-inducible protein OsmY